MLLFNNSVYLINVSKFDYSGVVNQDEAQKEMNLLPDFGLFEASHMGMY